MRAKNAFTRAVASGSSSCSARLSARSSFRRFLLIVVTIAGFVAVAGLRSSLAGG